MIGTIIAVGILLLALSLTVRKYYRIFTGKRSACDCGLSGKQAKKNGCSCGCSACAQSNFAKSKGIHSKN